MTVVLVLAISSIWRESGPVADASGQVKPKVISLQLGKSEIDIEGVVTKFDPKNTDVVPIVVNDRTLLPVRAIIQGLGGTIQWDEKENKVIIDAKGRRIELWIGKNVAKVDGADRNLDVDPMVINSRTMLPLRFIGDQLGYKTVYDSQTGEIQLRELRPENLTLEGNYKLAFSDDFDGDTLDLTKWSYNYWDGAHTHNHRAYMDEKNAVVKDGCLDLIAENRRHPDAPQVAKNGGKEYSLDYTSGAVTTYKTFHYTYGYAEARAKLPKSYGMWPAFWMLADGWPPEIDVLEVLTDAPNKLKINFHYGTSWKPEDHKSHYADIDVGFDLTKDYHIYACEWTPTYMKWYLDGKQVGETFTDTKWLNVTEPKSIKNAYLIFNLAVGGWAKDPDETTAWPAEYKIDWVRVWQKAEDEAVSSEIKD